MRDRRAARIHCRHHIERVKARPSCGVAFGDRLVGKTAGDVDQYIHATEMRDGRVDRLFCRRGVGQIDSAEFEAVRVAASCEAA